jgi:UDP-N-acetylmuramate dehydrogenase
MKIQYHISLKNYNSFGIDVNARELIEIEKPEELLELKDKIGEEEQLLFLGEGSNILFTKNFNGLIIKSIDEHIEVLKENEDTILIAAGAGLNWDNFVEFCLNQGWHGLENLSLIPGSIGSSPVQNIGAYGTEACDFIEEVFAYDITKSEFISISKSECEFGYRNSIFKNRKELFIYKVNFRLKKKPEVNISYAALKKYFIESDIYNPSPAEVRKAVIEIRQSKLPDHTIIGNAGSFFKNPVIEHDKFLELLLKYPNIPHYESDNNMVKIPAGWLIEKAGWKGKTRGEAGVHKDQALVLINLGKAKGSEIANLSEEIRLDINKNFGILLYPEVNIL